MTPEQFANSLTTEQMLILHEIIDGPVPQEIRNMSVDELLEALA